MEEAKAKNAQSFLHLQYAFDDTRNSKVHLIKKKYSMPVKVSQDCPKNNTIGQKPGITTCREYHDTTLTMNGKYVHVADRIGNVIEVFHAKAYISTSTRL